MWDRSKRARSLPDGAVLLEDPGRNWTGISQLAKSIMRAPSANVPLVERA